jgi:hypothetical protein
MTKKQTAPQEQCPAASSLEIARAIMIARAKGRNPGLLYYPADVIETASALNKPLANKLKSLGDAVSPKRILGSLISVVENKNASNRQRSVAIQLLRRADPLISGDSFTPGLGDDGKQLLLDAYVEALEGEAEVQREAIQAIAAFKQKAPASIVRKFVKVILEKMDAENQLFALQEISNFGTDLLSLVKSEIRELIVHANESEFGDEIKIIGSRLLGETRDTSDEALAILLQLTKSDQNREVRYAAVSVILQNGFSYDVVCAFIQLEEMDSLTDLLAEYGKEGRQFREVLETKINFVTAANASGISVRRRAYGRDQKFLQWNKFDKIGPKAIMERWNKLSKYERQAICPKCSEIVNEIVVKNAIKQAKKDVQ